MKPTLVFSLAALSFLILGKVQGAVTISSWSYDTLTTSSSLVPTVGTTVAAFDIDSSAASTLGGVTFSAATVFNSTWTAGGISGTYSVPSSSWAGTSSGFYTQNTVLNSTGLTYPSNNGTLELSGLQANQVYTFRFLVADSRLGATDGRTVEIANASVSGSSVTVSETSNRIRFAYQGQEQYGMISATFTADATGKVAFCPRIYDSSGNALGTQVNALQIIAIPEPSICLLGGLSFLFLLRRKREK